MHNKNKNSAHSMRLYWLGALTLTCLLAVTLTVVACNSGSSATASGMAQVKVTLSDPATCAAPDGPFQHVYVTISDVQANISSTAGDNDSGWVDLTPSLPSAPKQIDLLGQANNQCFLATLGDNQELQAGNYGQIRLILSETSANISGDMCSGAGNCVVLTSDGSTHPLQLSSEAKTGIKIPPGQIAGGQFSIAAGETKDLNIDFNTCESIVKQGNGQYRLKPVLHAGEIATTSSSINGKILDAGTGNPISGMATVNLEQPDSGGIDRVVMSATVASDGTFVFCPLPAGTYDVVVVGTNTSGAIYIPAIITGVSTGSTIGTVSLNPSTFTPTIAPTLTGQVTSTSSLSPAAGIDVTLSTLETVNSKTYTIPLPMTSTQSAATLTVETAGQTAQNPACPTGTFCANYSLQVPADAALAAAWSSSGVTFTPGTPTLATYTVDGMATSLSTSAATCSTSELQSTPATTLAGTDPITGAVPNLDFTSCQ
ncbi:MAG TPA: DUF4382 domain-containing protein [Terracidiphilus sp.]|nr:DUF4382 domain-containing protein [Terracidiphilus sp.]